MPRFFQLVSALWRLFEPREASYQSMHDALPGDAVRQLWSR